MKIFSPLLKNVFIALLSIFFLTTQVFAGSADCSIKNGMSEELTDYIKTMNNLLSRVSEEATKKQCDTNAKGENSATASIDKTQSAIVGSMNESIGFSNFYTSGRFYIDIALKTEIPIGITRDHERLGKEIEKINNMITLVHSRCSEDVVPWYNLSEDPVYNTSWKSLWDILKEVLQNQVNMMKFYRETVLWDKTDETYDFILVGNSKDFMSKVKGHYGPAAFSDCTSKSDFWKSIKDAGMRIFTLGGGIKAGIGEWRNALALLNSNSSDRRYAEVERDVLRREMSAQWMSTKGSQTIMNNLAKYNSQNSSEWVSGFVGSIGERVYSSVDQFGKVYDNMKAMLTKPQTTDKYMETTQMLVDLKTNINAEIITDYENAKSLMWPENQSADETVAKLIDTHILLESTNKFIKPYIKVAEQTCDGASTGEGNCRFK